MIYKKTVKKSKLIRLTIQLFFLLLIFLISINHQLSETGLSIPLIASASLHAVCPFGGVVSIYTLITEGSFIQKIHESSFVILSLVIILGILFGPVFCGWICPLGTVQELVSKIGRKIFKNKFNTFIPYKYDKYLRFLRYIIMVWVIFMTAYTAKLSFLDIDPYHALFNLWTSEVAIGGIIVLILTLTASLFVERPWCKYVCPFGAFLGLTNLIRIFKIKRNTSTCINCKKCNSVCPMNIEIANKEAVKNHQCITCLQCTSEVSCPVNDTLMLKTKGSKFETIKTTTLAILLFLIFFGGIYSSDLFGLWKTEASKTVRTINIGDSVGEKNPNDIKGSFSFLDISKNFDIPVSDLQKAFDIKNVENIENFKCKDLEVYYGNTITNEIGTGSVKMFVAFYKGINYTVTEDTYLPETAITLLKEKASLTEYQKKYIESHVVKTSK